MMEPASLAKIGSIVRAELEEVESRQAQYSRGVAGASRDVPIRVSQPEIPYAVGK